MSTLELLSEHACFGGVQRFYKHSSADIGLPMRFGLFLPPQALAGQAVPLLTFLAGLTCSEETFAIKAGAQRLAAELGLALVMPDTSPRDTGIAGATGDWDLPARRRLCAWLGGTPSRRLTAWEAGSPGVCPLPSLPV